MRNHVPCLNHQNIKDSKTFNLILKNISAIFCSEEKSYPHLRLNVAIKSISKMLSHNYHCRKIIKVKQVKSIEEN